jgi:hypothetical protein
VGRPGLRHLVQRPQGQAAAGKAAIDLADTEWQHAASPAAGREPVKALAQLGHNRIAPGMHHTLPKAPQSVMFLFCSNLLKRVN